MLTQNGKYEKTGVRQSKKGLWIMRCTKNNGTPVAAAYGEVIVYFYYINSIIILVS